MAHLLADPQRVGRALAQLEGAFAFVLMTRHSIMAARDRFGFKPLVMGRMGETTVFASESCALKQISAEYVRDVRPGELIMVDQTGVHSSTFADPPDRLAQCVFEMVYFARPDSVIFGHNVHMVRLEYGVRLAQEYPVEADIVVAVPDSGNSAALGYSRGSEIPLDFGFIRNHYIGRTFIMPDAGLREEGVDMKLAVLAEVVKGKRVVVVDDSIVRGTTARRRVTSLRKAGAREVHVRISCPPYAIPASTGLISRRALNSWRTNTMRTPFASLSAPIRWGI